MPGAIGVGVDGEVQNLHNAHQAVAAFVGTHSDDPGVGHGGDSEKSKAMVEVMSPDCKTLSQ